MFIELNEKNFEKETARGLKLIEFHAEWCGYCKMLNNILKDFEKIWIGQINVDKSPGLAKKFQAFSYPTLVFLKDGKEVDRLRGVYPKNDIMERIMKHLK